MAVWISQVTDGETPVRLVGGACICWEFVRLRFTFGGGDRQARRVSRQHVTTRKWQVQGFKYLPIVQNVEHHVVYGVCECRTKGPGELLDLLHNCKFSLPYLRVDICPTGVALGGHVCPSCQLVAVVCLCISGTGSFG